MSFAQKYYSLSFFAMVNFTLRVLKNIEKIILSMLSIDQREKANNALISSYIY